ncbi:MAG: O-methyltransferase [Nitrospinaceae bacterium]|jgi:caffeoyl-CoA O-methyltransferase|nr:O-methyltransferase [Nitrospinaceae bacterium]MDP6712640.1 O-methyltransferase [Nitrospinaceae bacterium]MDP7058285.1 O-methyltransferase [Nitrospinaceae bacterium]HAK37217.1 methyltransferase [Nitrospina sp.]|tara:strand:- start:4906 stop:5538 length:633 start_codon:yes stop_codon:yes gene_type:complete
MDFVNEDIDNYAYDHTQIEDDLLWRLELETHDQLEIPQMLTGRIEGRLLKMLAQLVEARRIIEIGTFGGYSALSMAEALPDSGYLITCEMDPVAIQFAQRFFNESPHGKKIVLKEGPALDTLKTLTGSFDMAFVDADKENYLNYYEALLPLMRPGGLIVVDNVLWGGGVLNPKETSDHAIHRFNQKVREDHRVEKVMLAIRDGVSLLRKR